MNCMKNTIFKVKISLKNIFGINLKIIYLKIKSREISDEKYKRLLYNIENKLKKQSKIYQQVYKQLLLKKHPSRLPYLHVEDIGRGKSAVVIRTHNNTFR